jgi:hypothetical protein
MNFDLRLPLGLIFGIFGALLVLAGAFGNSALNERSLGVNIDLIWGIVMLVFAAAMLVLAVRGRKGRGR